MPKLLIVILVLIAAVFAVGIASGRRDEQPAARTFDPSQLSGRLLSRLAGRVDPQAIRASCLQGKVFIVNPGTVCAATIAAAGDAFRLSDTRNLTLALNRGGAVDLTYDHGHRSAEPLDKLDHQAGQLPTDQAQKSAKVVVLRYGGTLTLKCLGPGTCVVALE